MISKNGLEQISVPLQLFEKKLGKNHYSRVSGLRINCYSVINNEKQLFYYHKW